MTSASRKNVGSNIKTRNLKRHLIILLTLVFYFGYSQCEDSDKLDLGGTYLSRTKNYISFEMKYKDSIYLEDISYPQDIKKIEKYYKFIYEKSQNYIENRGGKDFFKNLKIDHIEVNFDKDSGYDYAKESTYELSNFEYYSYWILYTYTNANIKYAFGLEFDKNGKMISENKFPEFSENKAFENLTDYCKALDLVRKDKRFENKEIDFIKLAYDDQLNSFCWLVKENLKIEKLGTHEYSLDLYYINANTNILESVKKDTGIVTACGFGVKLTEKKK